MLMVGCVADRGQRIGGGDRGKVYCNVLLFFTYNTRVMVILYSCNLKVDLKKTTPTSGRICLKSNENVGWRPQAELRLVCEACKHIPLFTG